MKMHNAQDVSNWRLCVGCGACYYACPKQNIMLRDIANEGIRPKVTSNNCDGCDICLQVCPGIETTHGISTSKQERNTLSSLRKGWGPIIEIWEGNATDPDIRYQGSSGGVASALSLYCVEKAGMYGVVHTGVNSDNPIRNKTQLSRSRQDILSRTGSRYLPASPCDSFDQTIKVPKPSVFIGKPCDVAALRKLQAMQHALSDKIGIAIGIFCAGTPATQGTLDLLTRNNIDPNDVEEIRFRGRGWPGNFTVKLKGKGPVAISKTYIEAWGFIQRYRPYRCYLCPDGTSEFADISCGDPWYREIQDGENGTSLVLVRTTKGKEILQGAIAAGYVDLKKATPELLEASQKNLLMKRCAIWGRIVAMKMLGVPTPRLDGFLLLSNWLSLPLQEKARSVLGTARRIIKRKYYKPIS